VVAKGTICCWTPKTVSCITAEVTTAKAIAMTNAMEIVLKIDALLTKISTQENYHLIAENDRKSNLNHSKKSRLEK